jgi:hypothetical protein
MPNPKSLLRSISIDVAGNSHNCQHNGSHRIQKGEFRLKTKRDGASPEHFCLSCALESVKEFAREWVEGIDVRDAAPPPAASIKLPGRLRRHDPL